MIEYKTQRLFRRLDTQAGPVGKREEAGAAVHRAENELLVAVENGMLVLVHDEVGQGGGRMQAGRLRDADIDGRMGHHLAVESLRQLTDADETGDAGVGHLRLNDVHAAGLQARKVFVDGSPLFSQTDARPNRPGHVRLTGQVLGRDRRLRQIEVVFA